VRKEFATPRRTVILDQEGEMEDEDLIQREDMVVTVSHLGYVKRVPLSTYRAQRRGGKGRAGMQTRERGFRPPAVRGATPTRRCCFSRRTAASTRKGLAACRRRRRRRAARR
jgi:DNA gyrase subunit A